VVDGATRVRAGRSAGDRPAARPGRRHAHRRRGRRPSLERSGPRSRKVANVAETVWSPWEARGQRWSQVTGVSSEDGAHRGGCDMVRLSRARLAAYPRPLWCSLESASGTGRRLYRPPSSPGCFGCVGIFRRGTVVTAETLSSTGPGKGKGRRRKALEHCDVCVCTSKSLHWIIPSRHTHNPTHAERPRVSSREGGGGKRIAGRNQS